MLLIFCKGSRRAKINVLSETTYPVIIREIHEHNSNNMMCKHTIHIHTQRIDLESKFILICAMVKSRYMGDGHPTSNRNPYNGYINPYYWVDDHPLSYGNNGSLDPSTYMYTTMNL